MSIPSAHNILRTATVFETACLQYGWGIGCLDCGASPRVDNGVRLTDHADDCFLIETEVEDWRVLGRERDEFVTLVACVSCDYEYNDLHFLVIVVPHDNDPEAVGAFNTPDFSEVLEFFKPGPGPDYPSNQPSVDPGATETPLLRFNDAPDIPEWAVRDEVSS